LAILVHEHALTRREVFHDVHGQRKEGYGLAYGREGAEGET
jgi:hypothetical protein